MPITDHLTIAPLHKEEQKPLKALLIGVFRQSAERALCEEHLEELELLAETYGIEQCVKGACHVRQFDAATYLSKGKLEEMLALAKEEKVDLILIDEEIAPAQQRNLEERFGKRVIDRTELILGVFSQRAQTKEARLQVELAQARYQAPRLKRLWTHLHRQRGTGGGSMYLKGEGEKQIEIDRRLIKQKIDLLQKQIEEAKAHRSIQRNSRQRTGISSFAIIGYTNAGKSTLLNALTKAGVFVEDKLFATLDTTTRKFTLPNNQEVLLVDTVGFIRKLPHQLVAAFRSTLEEALEADILIHLIDISNPMAEEQAATTFEVLKELEASQKPVITVLNKIDKVPDGRIAQKVRLIYPKTVTISALNHTGFEELAQAMMDELSRQRRLLRLRIPQSDYQLVSEVMREGTVLDQEYEENDILLKAEVPILLANRLTPYIQA